MSEEAKITSAYIVLFLFFIAAFVILAIVIHLIYIAHQKNKNKSRSNRCSNKQILFIIIITLFGIISFFISVVLMIALVIQILLIDGHKLESYNNFYSNSFAETEYLIVIFDELGHLSMLTVFIIRLKVCFANSAYGFSNNFMRLMYCCLIILIITSFIIIMQIVNNSNIAVIIISQIIWELLIESMCLWILYLFVSKLQSLVKNGLNSRKNLRLTISYNISQKSRSKRDENSINNQRSPSPSPSPSPRPTSPTPAPNQTVLNNQSLVNVMTKMTLLVLLSTISSFISLIGTIYIEIHTLATVGNNHGSIQQTWAWLLPVCDMIMTSFMLYLQFDFTKEIYSKLCTKCDIMFIQFCGDLLSKNVANDNKANQQIKVQSTTNTVQTPVPSIKKPSINKFIWKRSNSDNPITPPTTTTLQHNNSSNNIIKPANTTFRAPSPSPSPIAETETTGKYNVSLHVKRPSRQSSTNININLPATVTPRSRSASPRSPPVPPAPPSFKPKRSSSKKIDTSFWENAIANSPK